MFDTFTNKNQLNVHSRKLTWNLKISHWKRRFLLETIILRFHVKLWGCSQIYRWPWILWPTHQTSPAFQVLFPGKLLLWRSGAGIDLAWSDEGYLVEHVEEKFLWWKQGHQKKATNLSSIFFLSKKKMMGKFYTVRLSGPSYKAVWPCIADILDLQSTSFEIPWFLIQVFPCGNFLFHSWVGNQPPTNEKKISGLRVDCFFLEIEVFLLTKVLKMHLVTQGCFGPQNNQFFRVQWSLGTHINDMFQLGRSASRNCGHQLRGRDV